MRRAFVSHSTADDSFVAEMESFLRAAGFDDVFNDVHAIKPDEQFWPRIEQGITDCDAFVVVITAAATNSEWVKREVALARRLGKRVIPVWREDCPLPPDFTDCDVIDFRPRARKERRFDIGRIVKYAPAELIGREAETKLLTDAWQKTLQLEKGRPHVLTFVALGGEGKTSLVAKWAAELAGQDWPGWDAAFAWSFYSQGTREQLAASSDLFLKEALTFFGDEAMAGSAAGAFEKGRHLAYLVGDRRALLILDGLEPLQYAPTAPTPGELKDQGIAALLKDLATASRGLCVVTTRYSLTDLKAFWQTTAPEVKLLRLSRDAGVHLLKTLGVTGTAQEFETLVEDVKGHALTLTLFGGFLKRAFHGDIRQRDRVQFEKADEKIDGGHAFRTMAAYEQWLLRDGGDEGRREVAVLRLMGLFDRPADAGCLAALRSETIPGLTAPLAGLADDDWEYCLSGLEAAKLLTVNRDTSGVLISLDAHPLIREYFAVQLKWGSARASRAVSGALAGNTDAVTPPDQPAGARVGAREGACAPQTSETWRAAHRRLYEHLCATTPDKPRPTLEDLQPLYQAVAHGCQAEKWQGTVECYLGRIIRRSPDGRLEYHATRRLGAYATDLGAVRCFLPHSWADPSSHLGPDFLSLLWDQGALCLRAQGRLSEACEPWRTAVERNSDRGRYDKAAICANALAECLSTMGKLEEATKAAVTSVNYAEKAASVLPVAARAEEHTEVQRLRAFHQTTCGELWHLRGDHQKAADSFNLALALGNTLPAVDSPLASLRGFRRCEFRLHGLERLTWRMHLGTMDPSLPSTPRGDLAALSLILEEVLGLCEVLAPNGSSRLAMALKDLLDARTRLYRTLLLQGNRIAPLLVIASLAEAGLRAAAQINYLPLGLLTCAWLRFLTGARAGAESAQANLDEAWEIAERGPMRLHMADIHLYRARLFFRERAYPWKSPAADLAAAEKLINECGYHRRDEELADAKRAILGT